MAPVIYQNSFKTLRQAYTEVKRFIEENSFDTVKGLGTRIEEDLGLAGLDNYELLVKFVEKYNLDVSAFDYSKHFLSEGEIADGGMALYVVMIAFPLWVFFWVLRLLTTGRINYTKEQILPNTCRSTLDMTFGDLLIWYLTGKYQLRNDVFVQVLPGGSSCSL